MACALALALWAQKDIGSPPDPVIFTESSELDLPASIFSTVRESVAFPHRIDSDAFSLEYAQRVLLPSMGGAVAMADVDGDGREDIFVTAPGAANRLFRGRSDGTFQEVTTQAGLAGEGAGLSATFADHDHSGHPSLFMSGMGAVQVYRNRGNGTFADDTKKAGLRHQASEVYTGTVFFNIDGDGFPDLVVIGYTDFAARPSTPTFSFPNDFSGIVSRFYRNNGNGTFTDITSSLSLELNPGRGRKGVAADFDQDGHVDLLLLRDEKPPVLYLNRGGGKFQDFTYDADEQLSRNAFFDAHVSDFNHDGRPDLALWSALVSRVLLNQGGGRFELPEPWPAFASYPNPFGVHGTIVDVDGDGFDDFLAFDSRGKWRLLLNRNGIFTEAPVRLPLPEGAQPFRFLVSIRRDDRLYLVGLQSDGKLTVFKRVTPSG
jgi:enediyne biosynthesis protein E4